MFALIFAFLWLKMSFLSFFEYPAKPMHHHGSDCLRLRVDVVGHKGSIKSHRDKSKAEEREKEEKNLKLMAAGGVHNPSNRLPAGEDWFYTKQLKLESCLRPAQNWVCLPFLTDETLCSLPSLRWPCCHGAKSPEEYRQLCSTAGVFVIPFHHDPRPISDGAALSPTITPKTETIWSPMQDVGTWTLRLFLYEHRQYVLFSVCLMCLFAWMWSVDRSKEKDV